MKIMDFLSPVAINVNLQATDKKGAIKELVGLLIKSGEIKEKDDCRGYKGCSRPDTVEVIQASWSLFLIYLFLLYEAGHRLSPDRIAFLFPL